MTNFTAAEVLDALENNLLTPVYDRTTWKKTGEWEEAPELLEEDGWTELAGNRVVLNGVTYDIEEVDSTGGMDEGSNATVTLKIGDQYFRKSGYYASHYGYDWDGDFEEVHPVQKSITVYESI